MILRLAGLRDRAGALVDSATVQLVELVDSEGVAVNGITLPLSLIPLGTGAYEIPLPPTIEAEPGEVLYAKVVATSATAQVGTFTERVLVRRRSA